jgi:hypothetical protein
MRLTDGTPRARLTLALDLVAIVGFVLVGMGEHGSGGTLAVFARTAGPLLIAWLACATVFRTYRPPTLRTFAATILVAVPSGVLVRTAIVGSPQGWRLLTFLVVALVFVSLFVGTARVVATLVSRRFERGAA